MFDFQKAFNDNNYIHAKHFCKLCSKSTDQNIKTNKKFHSHIAQTFLRHILRKCNFLFSPHYASLHDYKTTNTFYISKSIHSIRQKR